MIYLDTSALVKGYVQEPGSAAVREAITDDPQISISVIGIVEFASALWRKVREEGLDEQEASGLLQEFLEDARHMWVLPLVDGQGAIVREALRLCREEALRAADSVHLATALHVARQTRETSLPFLASDQRLVEAAHRLGLRALNPTAPQPP